MKSKHIIIPIVLLITLTICTSIAITSAYYQDAQIANNEFSIGYNQVKIYEEFEPPDELTVGENIYKKTVMAENTGSTNSFIRLYANFSSSEAENASMISTDNGITWQTVSEFRANLPQGWIYIPYNISNILSDYYYYTKEITPGERTVPLFTHIKTTYSSAEEIEPYEIIVYAESVQTYNKDGINFTGGNAYENAWLEFLENRGIGNDGFYSVP